MLEQRTLSQNLSDVALNQFTSLSHVRSTNLGIPDLSNFQLNFARAVFLNKDPCLKISMMQHFASLPVYRT